MDNFFCLMHNITHDGVNVQIYDLLPDQLKLQLQSAFSLITGINLWHFIKDQINNTRENIIVILKTRMRWSHPSNVMNYIPLYWHCLLTKPRWKVWLLSSNFLHSEMRTPVSNISSPALLILSTRSLQSDSKYMLLRHKSLARVSADRDFSLKIPLLQLKYSILPYI